VRRTAISVGRDGPRAVAVGAPDPTERARPASSSKPIDRDDRHMTELRIDLEQLGPADRRDLANALLRAAWSATLDEVRILLLDLLTEVDDALLSEVG
jgi:hypothetical protein